jgi:chitin disaccharide deacetylase
MTTPAPIQLIVNADDYGYFPCVSRGIIELAQTNCVTATGILANRADLNTQLHWLDIVPQLQLGVHLNLTSGQPLTSAMREKLAPWQGRFLNAYQMSWLLLSGKLSITVVRDEWGAQIEACCSKPLVFLNSHEHIHMLPMLFPVVLELAKIYNIPHVRLTRADWLAPFTKAACLRNSVMQTLQLINQYQLKTAVPLFLGLSHSGKLNIDVLARLFASLKAGQCYELMCHPGHVAAKEISDTKLLTYHDWQAEFTLLQSPELQALYQQFNIHLTPYFR